MTTRVRVSSSLIIVATAALSAQAQNKAGESITAEDVQAHVDFLASDLLAGRDSGHPGAELAAKFIATQFKRLGLSQVGDGWQEKFRLPGGAAAGEAIIELGDERFAGAALVRAARFSPVASATAGLTSPDGNVQGRLVLVKGWENDGEARQRAEELIEKGAFGVCLISDEKWLATAARSGDMRRMGGQGPRQLFARRPKGDDESAGDDDGEESETLAGVPEEMRERLREQLESMGIDLNDANIQVRTSLDGDLPDGLTDAMGDGRVVFGGPGMFGGSSRLGAPVLRVSHTVGQTLLAAAEKGASMTVRVSPRASGSSTNVLALVEGSDPKLKNEYVVIGAHYDHVGADGHGAIWNGADDNASGTAGVLEIAEALASMKKKPRRSVILVLWGAEERGLVGSRAFAADPPVPMDRIAAYVNLDMISRNDPGSIGIISASDQMQEWAEQAAEAHGLASEEVSAFFLNASDSGPFVNNDVPTVFFFSGMHADYHKASDDPDKIDADKAARVARAAFEVVVRAANADERPEFTKPESSMPMMFGLPDGRRTLGVFPAGDDDSDGVLIMRIVPGSVAEAAGLQARDRIVRIAETAITKREDIGKAIKDLPVGETFEIEIVRPGDDGEEEVILKGKFEDKEK